MNILYIAKNLVVGMLAILAVIEFAYALYLKDNADVFDVFWVTPIFKFVSFVSSRINIILYQSRNDKLIPFFKSSGFDISINALP